MEVIDFFWGDDVVVLGDDGAELNEGGDDAEAFAGLDGVCYGRDEDEAIGGDADAMEPDIGCHEEAGAFDTFGESGGVIVVKGVWRRDAEDVDDGDDVDDGGILFTFFTQIVV